MERERLSQALAKQSYPAGASIIAEGERGDSLFILSAGEAQAEVDGVGVVRQYTSGEWFGELALISGEPRKATVIATTECTMLRLQRVDFERLIGELATHMETLRRRFGTAAYSAGGQDYSKLFRHYDVDNTGFLDLDEFRAACRKGGQVKVSDVGEREIRCLYHLIDMDGDGQISEADWAQFLKYDAGVNGEKEKGQGRGKEKKKKKKKGGESGGGSTTNQAVERQQQPPPPTPERVTPEAEPQLELQAANLWQLQAAMEDVQDEHEDEQGQVDMFESSEVGGQSVVSSSRRGSGWAKLRAQVPQKKKHMDMGDVVESLRQRRRSELIASMSPDAADIVMSNASLVTTWSPEQPQDEGQPPESEVLTDPDPEPEPEPEP
jgi:hypothetical protein